MTQLLYTEQKASSHEITTSLKQKVQDLQDLSLQMPQVAIVTEHTLKLGVYERKMIVPPWTLITGAEHKTPYKVRLEKGTIAVTMDDGVKILTAPCEFDAPAGIQRAGQVFEDEVVWVDVYDNPDGCTDIAAIEERLYVIPECGLLSNRIDLQLENKQNKADKLGLVEQGETSWQQ